MGRSSYRTIEAEMKSLRFRRSAYVVDSTPAGGILALRNARAIRPSLGLPTKCPETNLGGVVVKRVVGGTALNWDLLK